MCTPRLKVNSRIGLEEHLDKMVEQQQLNTALTHHTHTHTHTALLLTPVRYTGRHHLMACWVSTDSKASWESYVTFLASALLPALDL